MPQQNNSQQLAHRSGALLQCGRRTYMLEHSLELVRHLCTRASTTAQQARHVINTSRCAKRDGRPLRSFSSCSTSCSRRSLRRCALEATNINANATQQADALQWFNAAEPHSTLERRLHARLRVVPPNLAIRLFGLIPTQRNTNELLG